MKFRDYKDKVETERKKNSQWIEKSKFSLDYHVKILREKASHLCYVIMTIRVKVATITFLKEKYGKLKTTDLATEI